MFNLHFDICLVPFHAILTEITVFKIKQTFLEPPRISWKGSIKTNWITFGLVWRGQLFWVHTLLKEISTRDSTSNWLVRFMCNSNNSGFCSSIWKSFVKRLLQHAATWNSKWSKILSIVWFHGQDVAFVLGDMHLLMNIDDSFLTTSANVLTIKYNAS
jgi:hypothetical protein